MTRKLAIGLSFTLFVLLMFCLITTMTSIIDHPNTLELYAAEHVAEPKIPDQPGTITITNNILDVSVEDLGPSIGSYLIRTGSDHPIPNEDVFYDGWTSFTTIKVVETLREYVTSNHSPIPSEGYTLDWLDNYHWSITATEDDRKITSIWSIEEGLKITQVIEITGTTVFDTLVRISVNIFNQAEIPYTVGIRQEWDIMIDGEDGSYLRPWSSLGQPLAWLDVETDWTLPNFQFWETTNNMTEPLFSIYGSISSPAEASPSPTIPDHFVFASWGDSYDYAWDYIPTAQDIGGADSAVLYYWEPVELIPNAAREITSYVTTFKEAIESEGGIYRQPIQSIRLAEVVVVAGVVTAATTVLTSLTALGQAFNAAVDLLPIPSKLRSFLKLYGKKTFESVDQVQLDALERGSFISKYDLISLGLYILISTLVYGFVQANGFPRFFDPAVFVAVIPPTLVSVGIVSITSELTAALCAQTNQVYRQFRLWFYGLTSFLISGLILLFPFASPGITRYQSREISAQTKGLIVLFKMLVTLSLAIPFASLHLLGYTIIGDVGLLMILMRVCYSLVPVRPLAGRAVFDYSKQISLLALAATGILFISYSMYLLPYGVYVALGVVAAYLAFRTFNQLRIAEELPQIL